MASKRNLMKALCLVLCLVLALPSFAFAQVAPTTTNAKVVMTGVTRAEVAGMINKAFGFTVKDKTNFKDVKAKDLFFNDLAIAKKAGYLVANNKGLIEPLGKVSRQEFAVLIKRVMDLDKVRSFPNVVKLKDSKIIPTWSKDAIESVLAKGFMKPDAKKYFNPSAMVTKADVASTLSKCFDAVVVTYNKAGTYSAKSVAGSLVINAANTTLESTVIRGNLIIDKSVGEGNVKLKKVTVLGDTLIKGGGSHSITIENCVVNNIIVTKVGGEPVRLVAVGSTTSTGVNMQSSGTLQESNVSGSGFGKVTLSQSLPPGAQVNLAGSFPQVQVNSDQVGVNLTNGSIGTLNIAPTAINTNINLSSGVAVTNLSLGASANIAGTGTVSMATVAGNNVALGVTGATQITTMNVSVGATNASLNLGAGTMVTNMTMQSSITLGGTGTVTTAIVAGNNVTMAVTGGMSITNLAVAPTAANSNVSLAAGTNVATLTVNSNANVFGTGTIGTATVNVAGTTISAPTKIMTAAIGVTVNTTPTAAFTAPGIPTPPIATLPPSTTVTPPASSGGGGGGSSTVAVSSISVTGAGNAISVDNGGTLQMSATITPMNATNQTITWTVTTLSGGTATINSTTGMLTATGVGTVTVTATNSASGITGTRVITVTASAGSVAIYSKVSSIGMPTSVVKVKIDGSYVNTFEIYFDGTQLATTSNGKVVVATSVLSDLSRVQVKYSGTLRSDTDAQVGAGDW